jgi:hypothetical protein
MTRAGTATLRFGTWIVTRSLSKIDGARSFSQACLMDLGEPVNAATN